LRLLAHDALLRFDPQTQFQLPVNAIDALVVPAESLGISSATFYKWRSKYGGMDTSMMS